MYIRVNIGVYQPASSACVFQRSISERVTRSIQSASHKDLNRAKHVDSNLDDFCTQCLLAITSSGHLEKQTDKSEHFGIECCAMSNIFSICYFEMDEFSITLPSTSIGWNVQIISSCHARFFQRLNRFTEKISLCSSNIDIIHSVFSVLKWMICFFVMNLLFFFIADRFGIDSVT